MKIYVQDHGVFGCIVVAAESKDEAREMMKDCYQYRETVTLEEVEIEPGIIWENLGDT